MASKKRRENFVQVLERTEAIQRRRDPAKRRLGRAKREALAAKQPGLAQASYKLLVQGLRFELGGSLSSLVLGRLPELGGGEALDLADLHKGITELEKRGLDRAAKSSRALTAVGRKVSTHAASEVGRVLGLKVSRDARTEVFVSEFVGQQQAALAAAVTAQADKLRQVLAEYKEGTSLRGALLESMWVSTNRTELLAKWSPEKFQAQTFQYWAQNTGGTHYIWHTAKDERVRPGHAALDGKVCSWRDPPSTGRGRAHPGQEPNCRCRAIPTQATYDE